MILVVGCMRRYVYQGVHMLFTGETLTKWGDAPRINRLIFIGKNLDRAELKKGFEACLSSA
jgi:G3E family GTPase